MSDLVIIKGDTTIFDVFVTRVNQTTGVDEPVTTIAKAWFTAKRNSNDIDDDAFISLDSVANPAQVVITPLAGTVRITLSPGDTVAYDHNWLEYDVQVKEVDGTVTTVRRGQMKLLKHATVTIV